jgi:hypothetical protein
MARGGSDEEYGTAIEVYPRDEVMMPGSGESDMVQLGQVENPPRYGAFHLAVGTKLSRAEIIAIGKREGWRAVHCDRGRFDLVEFWLENSLMIEFLDPKMQATYKSAVAARGRMGKPATA